jgi:hypothetical protein
VEPRPKENEVVSFAYFHSFGFRVPLHPLLWWLLYYYGLCVHELTPQGILHLSIFIMLCEGFLGVPASMCCGGLYSGWFAQRPGVHLPRMGGTLIKLHSRMEDRYLSLDHYPSTDLGWQKFWLYIPNESSPLLSYSPNRLRGDLPESWEELPPQEDT